jgi:hypothetical protein
LHNFLFFVAVCILAPDWDRSPLDLRGSGGNTHVHHLISDAVRFSLQRIGGGADPEIGLEESTIEEPQRRDGRKRRGPAEVSDFGRSSVAGKKMSATSKRTVSPSCIREDLLRRQRICNVPSREQSALKSPNRPLLDGGELVSPNR